MFLYPPKKCLGNYLYFYSRLSPWPSTEGINYIDAPLEEHSDYMVSIILIILSCPDCPDFPDCLDCRKGSSVT